MEKNIISKLNDEKLVDIAGSAVVGTTSGLKSQHVQAELMRSNTEAMLKASESADHYADKMMGLTLIVGFIAFLQLVFMIISSESSVFEKLLYGFGVVSLVTYTFYDYFAKEKV